MGLPIVPPPSEEFELAGEKIHLRSLSRGEILKLGHLKAEPDEAETFLIAASTGLPAEEVAAWRQATDPQVVETLSDRVLELSGLLKGAQKSG